MKNEGGREAGKCSKMVPDRGDRCLFTFLSSRRLFFKVFPFPVHDKAQLIGEYHKNRRGAPNTILLLIIRQYYWRTDVPCAAAPTVMADRTQNKNYWRTVSGKHCLLAEGDIGAPIYWRTDAPRAITIGGPMVSHLLLADRTEVKKKEADRTVQCASSFFKPIAY
jgi:hypothetical protein